MLNMTKVELKLIPDPDMYIFFNTRTRSEASYVPNRCSRANNKYLKSYDPKQESKHIIYLKNNLCGYVTSKFRPRVSFK